MGQILYAVARDQLGNRIRARDAEKGIAYSCPRCEGEFILRKSGKTGKHSRRPHFAHKSVATDCTPEGVLHYEFKNLLLEKIRRHVAGKIPLEIRWDCQYCRGEHVGNLLKKATSVEPEHNMDVARADLALLDETRRAVAVIELVVTHKPEASILKHYRDNKVVLVQINLVSDEDLDKVEDKLANPSVVETCLNPRCKKCGLFQKETVMKIAEGVCWKCEMKMRAAIVKAGGRYKGPDRFTRTELEIARQNGVLISRQFSDTSGSSYNANTCGYCGNFVGKHFLIGFFADARVVETVRVSLYCDHRA